MIITPITSKLISTNRLKLTMPKYFFKSITLTLSLVLISEALMAHHSVAANFDMQSTIELTGTVTKLDFVNPHSHITIDVTDDEGKVVEWLLEWSDRNALIRRGVDIKRIKVGDIVEVNAMKNRRLEHVGYFRHATLPDGTIFRDCGFTAFRESVKNKTEFICEDPLN